METKYSTFEKLFMNDFQKGKFSVFVIVSKQSNGGHPIIMLIHRLRFGSEILPIPAWLDTARAEQFMQSREDIFGKAKVMEVTHQKLQEMIEKHEYDMSYPQAISYHLDLQVDKTEVSTFLRSKTRRNNK
jgi:hypothetical protein